ncbi:MAG: DUF362 domain-containing protein [Armatimonadetes bacterium]|nr:DUF362 domain-containing protein [Armatimonadota bacterium]
MNVPPVSLRRCASYEPADLDPALDALLADLGGLSAFVAPGQRVLLKPNLISDSPPERAATTHPALVEALARRIQALGATPFVADAPAWGAPQVVARATGMLGVCERLGIEWVGLDQKAWLPSTYPSVARGFHVDPRVLGADVVINLPKFKGHQQLGFTGAVKNLYGCLAGREKAYHHCARSRTDAEFARYLVAYAAAVPVALHLSDGVLAMEGAGPRLGQPRALGWLAASTGAVEVDAVCADLVQAPASHRLLLDAAAELGYGETDPARIARLGDAPESLRVDDFAWPELLGVFFSPWRLLRGWWRNRKLMAVESMVSR